MRGSADEIDSAGAQCRVALIDGVDELERDIEAFPLEKSALDRRIHGDVGAPFVCKPLANLEVLALDRHFCLALELGGPMAEIIAVPWRLRCERRQPEPLPDRPGPFHELALRQRNWRIDAF